MTEIEIETIIIENAQAAQVNDQPIYILDSDTLEVISGEILNLLFTKKDLKRTK